MNVKMKAYKSLKNGKFLEIGNHGVCWYAMIDPASIMDGKIMPTLVPLDYKAPRVDGHELGQIEEVVFTFDFENKKRATLPCRKCGGDLKPLKTKSGDPEGIRNDVQCKKCKTTYGCSKAHVFELEK